MGKKISLLSSTLTDEYLNVEAKEEYKLVTVLGDDTPKWIQGYIAGRKKSIDVIEDMKKYLIEKDALLKNVSSVMNGQARQLETKDKVIENLSCEIDRLNNYINGYEV